MLKRTIIVTGGAGFIGSALIRLLIKETGHEIINIDKLSYASNLDSLLSIADDPRYHFEQADICDHEKIESIFSKYRPDIVMHLAAESHVDRSIDNPANFIHSNITGTFTLLEIARLYWQRLANNKQQNFRFHHISTDEVFGTLDAPDLFDEEHRYDPSSPYSASKASADHLVRAWHRTYQLPIVITHSCNNYGPYHFPEKLIPLVILNALEGKSLPIYGSGLQVRDWVYVEDHARALYQVAINGVIGETYNIGGNCEKTNLQVVESICKHLDQIKPPQKFGIKSYSQLILHVDDRPGHDLRYAIDTTKIKQSLNWSPQETFATGLLKTVQWYIDNQQWCQHIQENNYQRQRIGLDKEINQ